MKEHEVIAKTALYLINERHAKIKEISTPKKHEQYIKKTLSDSVSREIIDDIKFSRKGKDIVADLDFKPGKTLKPGKTQKHLEIEAKGGTVYYNFYTSLGQFICLKKSPSTYYWFAFALPYSWRKEIRKMLRDSDRIKPIIEDIIRKYTKNGQGLWFYFVDNSGNVKKETWTKTLKKDKNDTPMYH